jgi:hypothetical protein
MGGGEDQAAQRAAAQTFAATLALPSTTFPMRRPGGAQEEAYARARTAIWDAHQAPVCARAPAAALPHSLSLSLTHTQTHTSTYPHTYIYVHTSRRARCPTLSCTTARLMPMGPCMPVRMCADRHMCTHAQAHVHARTHTHAGTHIGTYTQAQAQAHGAHLLYSYETAWVSACVCLFVCLCACLYVCLCPCACLSLSLSTSLSVCRSGHALNKILKDVTLRYQLARGRTVRCAPGEPYTHRHRHAHIGTRTHIGRGTSTHIGGRTSTHV